MQGGGVIVSRNIHKFGKYKKGAQTRERRGERKSRFCKGRGGERLGEGGGRKRKGRGGGGRSGLGCNTEQFGENDDM